MKFRIHLWRTRLNLRKIKITCGAHAPLRTLDPISPTLMHALAHTHTHTHIHAHAEMYARIFAFLIRRKRQHGDWSTVSTCACTTGGKGDSYGEAKSIERDAGKSACTRTQQRQQRRQQQQQQRQHPPMISPSRSLPDRASLLFLSSNFLSFSRFYRREGWKPSASR